MKKYAIHLGLNFTDYKVDNETLISYSAFLNATFYHELAKNNGFSSLALFNEEATSKRLIEELNKLSNKLEDGDLLFFSYSGHGGQIYSDDEPDFRDEVLFLFDRVFLDDEFKKCWSDFNQGVHIFIVTNSCSNGTLIDSGTETENLKNLRGIIKVPPVVEPKNYISSEQYFNYLQGIKFYTNAIKRPKNPIIHISSSKDNFSSPDSRRDFMVLSEFTTAFKGIIESGFKGNYNEFYEKLHSATKTTPFFEDNTDCDTDKMKNFWIKDIPFEFKQLT